jgi:16S rRNA processing protein RimM
VGGSIEWVTIARMGRPRGLRGELFADGWSRLERYRQPGSVAFRKPDGEWFEDGRQFEVLGVSKAGNRVVFRFAGIDSVEQAKTLTGFEAVIPASERPPLPEGEFYLSDLVGCVVMDRHSGREIGAVTGWQEFGGPEVLEITPPGKTWREAVWIPLVKSICVEIDASARRIVVDPPEGLLELNVG